MKYFTCRIHNKKQIVIDKIEEDLDVDWAAFVSALPLEEPRYAVADVAYTTDDGREQKKLTFFVWSPDDKTTVKDRMLYASSKDAIKKKLVGLMKEVQANDTGDLDEQRVQAEVKK